jgi:hypothetical protein
MNVVTSRTKQVTSKIVLTALFCSSLAVTFAVRPTQAAEPTPIVEDLIEERAATDKEEQCASAMEEFVTDQVEVDQNLQNLVVEGALDGRTETGSEVQPYDIDIIIDCCTVHTPSLYERLRAWCGV